jgi:ABC-type transport system involved in cytochrome c biogenesis permease subunit
VIKIVKGIFFKFYYWNKRLNIDNIPELTAISLVAILGTINIITIVHYIKYALGSPWSDIPVKPSGVLSLILMVLLYFSLIRKEKHVDIFKEYSKTDWARRKGSWIVIIYSLVSVAAFASLIWTLK